MNYSVMVVHSNGNGIDRVRYIKTYDCTGPLEAGYRASFFLEPGERIADVKVANIWGN